MRTPLIAFTALSLLAGVPATASDFVVHYDDLDLSTAKGQKALDRRITAAAREYCGMASQQTGTRIQAQGAKQCFDEARAAARQQVAALVSNAGKGG